MERVAGIEPAYSRWERDTLPLGYTRFLFSPHNGRSLSGFGLSCPHLAQHAMKCLTPFMSWQMQSQNPSLSNLRLLLGNS